MPTTVRPFDRSTVSRDEGAPQIAATPESEERHEHGDHEHDAGAGKGDGGRVLHHDRAGHLLRARGEVGVLRADRAEAAGLQVLRVPVDAAAATEQAWSVFHDHLHAFVARRVSGPDADDIVQRIFLQMHKSLGSIEKSDRLGAWLFQAARNAIADHYRAPRRRREVLAGAAGDLESAGGVLPEDEASEHEAAGCLRPMIARLGDADRRALELIELQGLSQAAAARLEGVSLSGMKSRVQRARRRLKDTLVACCRIAKDARGGVMGCESREGAAPCRPGSSPRGTEC